ncbi:hypothetical protein ASG25_02470 [Rhizobium sp. Leaf384]|uniref:hypothetical protein n=1 Tax=unclassified Rhizobium TaxID=2613769 RepID=UPI00071564DE|nr:MULTISPECIES: hypothetical protein [unclassified Rhizobium]KQS80484.1 hypothetical protein ASG25_02470 [Rhizobium sp. Leaf384]KQS86534.1 hypothetical protein ASG58_17540 [Rhizobium sp. Leaf383]
MKRPGVILGMIGALSMAGCQRETGPGPTEVSGRLFVFNYRIAQAHYMITLRRTAPLPDPAVAVTTFEDPRGGEPLVTRTKIFPFWDTIVLESPPIHCVRKDRSYRVGIRILDGADRLVQAIETTAVSTVDQTVLTAKPLVVGPGYAVNPDILRADGSVDYAPETGCPA